MSVEDTPETVWFRNVVRRLQREKIYIVNEITVKLRTENRTYWDALNEQTKGLGKSWTKKIKKVLDAEFTRESGNDFDSTVFLHENWQSEPAEEIAPAITKEAKRTRLRLPGSPWSGPPRVSSSTVAKYQVEEPGEMILLQPEHLQELDQQEWVLFSRRGDAFVTRLDGLSMEIRGLRLICKTLGMAKRALEEPDLKQAVAPKFPDIAAFDVRFANSCAVLLLFSLDNRASYQVYSQ
ncbi:hypothetical protein HDU89_008273 [Geranomyces variabilis]|nr:hypothetical protein HDU89_008273 [Geranomyces variabilis]